MAEVVAAGDDDARRRERVDDDDLVVDDGEAGGEDLLLPARRDVVAQRHRAGSRAGPRRAALGPWALLRRRCRAARSRTPSAADGSVTQPRTNRSLFAGWPPPPSWPRSASRDRRRGRDRVLARAAISCDHVLHVGRALLPLRRRAAQLRRVGREPARRAARRRRTRTTSPSRPTVRRAGALQRPWRRRRPPCVSAASCFQ